MRRALLAAALLLGCKPTVYIHTAEPEAQRVTIRDASRKLGVRLKTIDRPEGAVHVEFKPHDEGVCGVALERNVGAPSIREALTEGVIDCQPKAWSCDEPHFLAHELGHVLGLNHEEGTLMDPEPGPDAELTKRQSRIVDIAAAVMSEACPRHPDAVVTDPYDPPAE